MKNDDEEKSNVSKQQQQQQPKGKESYTNFLISNLRKKR